MTEITQVPYSPAAEMSVLGAVLIDPESLAKLKLSADDFYLHHHRMIFDVMRTIYAKGGGLDYTTVCSELSQRSQLGEIGGPAYIMRVYNDTVSAAHLDSYADIVRKLALRRTVIAQAETLMKSAYDQDSDLDAAIGETMDKLSRINTTKTGAVHISEIISEIYDEVEQAAEHPQDIYGIPTGFPDWDAITHGLQPGTVIKIVGEPGVGKSLLAVQVLAQCGRPGALYELEMKRKNVVRRLLSARSKIPTYKMQSGKIDDDEWPAFTDAIDHLSSCPVYIAADSQLTTGDIRSDLYRLKSLHGIEVAVVDYESILCDTAPGKNDENTLSMLRSSRLHSIAVDLDIAIISLDDMNKEGIAGNRPGVTGMSGSARKAHDADEVIMMRRDKDNARLVTYTFEKNREGPAKRFFQLMQQAAYPAFDSVARRLP